jgi:hypothetical protein
MNIEILKTILPQPKNPSETTIDNNWPEIESKLGIQLPEDYKSYINYYGTGRISNFLWIFNPFSKNENLNLIHQVAFQHKIYSDLKNYHEEIPYKLYPDTNGIIPFGMTDNGDILFWIPSEISENWPVIINEARSPEWQKFDVTITTLLFDLLTDKKHCDIFPKNFPSKPIAFESSSSSARRVE